MEEVKIHNILKQLRILKGIAKQHKTAEEWKDLMQNYALKAYSDFYDS